MDELPADAEMAVNRAGSSAGDAVSDRADPTKLLDVEMDEFARMFPFVRRTGSGSNALSLLRPSRRRTQLTAAGEMPASTAICLPVQR